MFWGSCSASLGAPCGTCPWEGDNGTPAHLTATREQGQEQRKQPQAVQGSIRTDVRNSFSLEEWPGSVRSCLWRWWGHHPWQCSRGIWMWHLGHGYGEIVVVLERLFQHRCCEFCGSSAALSRLAWHSRVLSWHSRHCTPLFPAGLSWVTPQQQQQQQLAKLSTQCLTHPSLLCWESQTSTMALMGVGPAGVFPPGRRWWHWGHGELW